jgi:hypothetical protein
MIGRSYIQGHAEDRAVRVAYRYTEWGWRRVAYTSYVQGHAEDGSARVASYTPLEDKVWRLARAHSEQARDLNAASTGGTWHSLIRRVMTVVACWAALQGSLVPCATVIQYMNANQMVPR